MNSDSSLLLRGGFCAISLLIGCSLGSSGGPGGQSDLRRALLGESSELARDEASVPRSSQAQFEFMLGELALKEEKYEEALSHFERAGNLETTRAVTLRKRLAQLYVRQGSLDKALKQLELATADVETQDLDEDILKLKAGILASSERTEEAVATYRQLIEISGDQSEEPYIFAASLQAQSGDLVGAERTLIELLAKNEDSFFGTFYLAKVLVVAGNLDEAEKQFKRALEINPAADSVQLELARVYAFQKRMDEAIRLCEEVVENNPGNVRARTLLGELLLGKDKVDEALQQFERLQKLEEDPSETRFKIALIKLQRRDLEGAEVELRLILAQHSDHAPARYYLASAFAGMKRLDDAVDQLRQINAGQQYFAEARTLGAYLLRQDDRPKEALAMLAPLVKERSDDMKLLTFYASLQRDSKDFGGAIETTQKIVALEPNNDQHYFTLGVFYDETDNSEKANEAMKKAIELNPKNANALNYLAYTYAEDGVNLAEAELLVKRAIEIEPTNGYFIDTLGWVYFQSGRFDLALEELKKAAELVEDDAVILEHLARAYLKNNDSASAKQILEKALPFAPESDDKDVEARIQNLLQTLK